jgi:hypothetical protein
MPIFTGCSSRARIGSGAPIALAVHARPALRTARRPIRRACGDAAFRVFGYKLSAPNQPGQTLLALAYVGKARDGIVTKVLNFGVPTQIDVRVQERDAGNNKRIAALLQQKMARVPGVVEAHIQQELDAPEMYRAVDRGRAKPVFVPIPKKNRVWPKPNLNFGLTPSNQRAEGLKPAPIAAWAANVANGMGKGSMSSSCANVGSRGHCHTGS